MSAVSRATAGTVSGSAVVYNSPAVIGGAFIEMIEPGALNPALRDQATIGGCAMLRDHDPSLLLGRIGSGTLRVHDTSRALRFEVDLPDTTAGREVAELMARGDLRQCSFGFIVARDGDRWHETKDGHPVRVITQVQRLLDLSLVTYPAYPETEAALQRADVASRRLALARRRLWWSSTPAELPDLGRVTRRRYDLLAATKTARRTTPIR